jgi:uncharacterized membrane protein
MSILGMDTQDSLAFLFFVISWLGYAVYSDHESQAKYTLVNATNRWRLNWMREMLARENRSVDAITVGNLTRSFTFFASTTMFILAALVSMLGYREKANAIFSEIPFAKISEGGIWQMKISLLIIIFTFAFFKFTWSMRQYNYVSIFIAAVPDHRMRKEEHEKLAQAGAALTGNAARHFNNGLRAYYFGLAVLGWFVHPYIFMLATALVVRVTYRREYRSSTLKHLSNV